MKVVARMVQIIGEDEWVDETIKRSVDGVFVVLPGRRLIRSSMLGMIEITAAELATVEAKADPQEPTHPLRGRAVTVPCIECKRAPREGETFGPHAEGWDFTGICPECWDRITAEPHDEDDDEATS